MRKSILLIAVGLASIGGLFLHPRAALAVDCNGLGNLTVQLNGNELSTLKPEITVQAQYKWKSLTADKLPCLDELVVVYVAPEYTTIPSSIVFQRFELGKVTAGETRSVSAKVTYQSLKPYFLVLPGNIYNIDIIVQAQSSRGVLSEDLTPELKYPVKYDSREAVKIYACVTSNAAGQPAYSCSQKPDCSDAGCGAVAKCDPIDSRMCGQPVGTPGPTTSGASGQGVPYQFSIPNPLGVDNFIDLLAEVSRWVLTIAIPIAVLAIVYSGILWLTAGAYPSNSTKAKDVLKYALIGLAIIIVGRGFITLIESIVNLGSSGSSATPTQTQSVVNNTPLVNTPVPPAATAAPSGKPLGGQCLNAASCQNPYLCSSNKICRRAGVAHQGDPCKTATDCNGALNQNDFQCDTSVQNHQVIDGQVLGSCVAKI